tara:strand:- start:462 stop:584 length:123 start_codon:yes stop_codon:yes gene_type:complete
MKETLEILKQFAANGDNIWLQDKLDLLEDQITYTLLVTVK